MGTLKYLLLVPLLTCSPILISSQSFCLSELSINKQTPVFLRTPEEVQPCKIYWINIYIHRILGYIEDGVGNGWKGYNSTIDSKIMNNLNSSYNQYGFYFQLVGSRDWFTRIYSDPERHDITLMGITDDPQAYKHDDAIDIYLLPSNSQVSGGYVPSNDQKVMLIGGTRTIEHCTGEILNYEVAATNVVSHEMGHCLGLPHTFDVSLGTTIDNVRENACVDPTNCRFVSNCTNCNVSTNPTIEMNNFMSYTVPNCMSEFSDQQVDRMRQTLNNSMAQVVDRVNGAPLDISDEIIGPPQVAIASEVWFEVPDQIESNDSLIWSFPAGFILTGEEEDSRIQLWISPNAESGNISVRKTNLCGYSQEKFKYVDVLQNDCSKGCSTVEVFPNPAFGKVYISHFQDSNEIGLLKNPVEYLLSDLHGRKILVYQSALKHLTLDLSGISSGVYLLSIHGNMTPMTRKLAIVN